MSQVNWNRQLGLAIALVSLGTLAFWLEYKHRPDEETAEEQSKRIFQVKDTSVQSITLAEDSKKFVLTCTDFASKLCKPGDNSKWEVTQPSQLRADDSNVNSLLSTLNTLTSTEVIDLKDETPEKRTAILKEYGLDAEARKSPKVTKKVHIVTASGETILYLGNTHPIGESIFAIEEKVTSGQKAPGKVDENRVYLVPSFFKASLDHDLTYWRDKKLLSWSGHEIESFKLDGSKAHLTGERKNSQWLLHVNQEELSGDIENVDSLMSSVAYLTAKNFASDSKNDAKAKAALKGLPQALTLTLHKEKGSAKEAPAPITLQFFHKKSADPKNKAASEKAYVTVSNLDPLFEIDAHTVDRLDKSVKDLRLTKLITSMDRFSAKKLKFEGQPFGALPLALTQTNGKWVDADKKPVSQEKVQEVLDRLTGNRIKEFLEGKAIPSGDKEGLKIVIGDEKTEVLRQLVFWKKDGKLYAKDLLSKRNEAYLVDSTVQNTLPWDRDFFKPAAAAPMPNPLKKNK